VVSLGDSHQQQPSEPLEVTIQALQTEVRELKKTLEHVRSDLVLVRLIHAPSAMTSPPITVSLTAAPLPTSVVPGAIAVGTPADSSVGVVAPEGLEDPRKSEQEQGMLKASPVGRKDTLTPVQGQSQLVVGVAPEGLKDTRKSEQEQGMLLASPTSLKDTLKSEHVEDSATGATGHLRH
jgi:hypothetical protein